jgi:hypothetical protein
MGILLVIGMMVYAAGLCRVFQRVGERSSRVPDLERGSGEVTGAVVVPDRVPHAWVESYRSEPGG